MLKKLLYLLSVLIITQVMSVDSVHAQSNSENYSDSPPIYIAFHWHMHQPIYWPYESVVETEERGAYSFSLQEVHTSRTGPYTNWPSNAVQMGIDADMSHFGAQVSFSGSLIENLEAAREAGWGFQNWTNPWNSAINQTTELGNPRLQMTGFGYHHPLMPFIDKNDIRRQVQWHKEIMGEYFDGEYAKGIFPPETAFSPRIIPALVEEGFEWVLVDNLHFERASAGAPLSDESGVLQPNRADVRNPNPGDWNQLNGLWAPTPVSMQWAHQPRYVSYTDPDSGEKHKMIAVPASRYLGEEDGRGGFGALQYEHVMSQFESYNTDPNQPILLVLHHDGDNHGGGSEAYYNHNFQNMVNWLQDNPDRFVVTTIQDYLDKYPPDPNDIIHVQDGSWLGADGGDPQFKKWMADPYDFPGADEPYSPDRNSYSIMIAAKNVVETAEQINSAHPDTERAWEFLLNGQASDYWYWTGTEVWDSNPARAANQAIEKAESVANSGADQTGPSIFLPQRTPYNPGSIEWFGQGPMPSDFEVWTYVYDISGLESVNLKYRISESDQVTDDNMTYAGGTSTGDWESVEMSGKLITSITDPFPLRQAKEYRAEIAGLENVMVDYYVEATDTEGNTSRSVIQHVWVGDETGSGVDGPITWEPTEPAIDDLITITIENAHTGANLHWGVNDWNEPIEEYWPSGSFLFEGSGPAVQSPMNTVEENTLEIQIGPFNDSDQAVSVINFVISYDDGSWENNNDQDYHINIAEATSTENNENPDAFALKQNYPNPFNPVTVIPFSLDKSGHVTLTVYDMLSRRVATVVDEFREAGSHNIHFDASSLAGGVYFYRLQHEGRTLSGKMTLIK